MRQCLALDLRDDPALIARYEALHRRIWPEVAAHLRSHGVTVMEIHRLGTRMVMVMETDGAVHDPRGHVPGRCHRPEAAQMGGADVDLPGAHALDTARRQVDSHGLHLPAGRCCGGMSIRRPCPIPERRSAPFQGKTPGRSRRKCIGLRMNRSGPAPSLRRIHESSLQGIATTGLHAPARTRSTRTRKRAGDRFQAAPHGSRAAVMGIFANRQCQGGEGDE